MQPFNESLWDVVDDGFGDITFHRAKTVGLMRIAIDRPECRNAFRPQTVD
ncbi:MAG: 1,4-dihydroxy-2-naphthoyl-CoA synthase, partial [Candidatus Margulisbacteria bacterium]|nr:1,4-dihydroxy-2-naphthoyl-CoA synthase [Candidatus Margulisiibacteriota bacterium]